MIDLNHFLFCGHCNNGHGDVTEAHIIFYCLERFMALWHFGQIKCNSRHTQKKNVFRLRSLLSNRKDFLLLNQFWRRSLEIRSVSVQPTLKRLSVAYEGAKQRSFSASAPRGASVCVCVPLVCAELQMGINLNGFIELIT